MVLLKVLISEESIKISENEHKFDDDYTSILDLSPENTVNKTSLISTLTFNNKEHKPFNYSFW